MTALRIYPCTVKQASLDDYIAEALAAGVIRVDGETGAVLATRGALGKPLQRAKPLGVLVRGYLVASVRLGCRRKMVKLHRVVWIASHGLPGAGLAVCHVNNDKKDNRIANLYLATAAQNSADAARDGLYRRGADNPSAKLTDGERAEILRLYTGRGDGSVYGLARRFGISKSRVQQLVSRAGA